MSQPFAGYRAGRPHSRQRCFGEQSRSPSVNSKTFEFELEDLAGENCISFGYSAPAPSRYARTGRGPSIRAFGQSQNAFHRWLHATVLTANAKSEWRSPVQELSSPTRERRAHNQAGPSLLHTMPHGVLDDKRIFCAIAFF
jgi:hypothetical protein